MHVSMSIINQINRLQAEVRALKEQVMTAGNDMRTIARSEVSKRWTIPVQAESYYGLYLAICVDTIDRDKQNRVRFFSPLMNKPDVPYTSLDWAYPVSNTGGIDDSGCNWVPPAGSLLCILFAQGYRSSPFYIGTTWTRNRGQQGEYFKGYEDFQEYWKIHDGHRKGYLVGEDDESQVFPPWNTESYQGMDLDSTTATESVINAQLKNMTYPHIYGWKTPQKHMIKMDDGDYKCNHRWKRFEIQSSAGGYMVFKDDHLHEACQWAHPKCNCDRTGSIQEPCHETWITKNGATAGFKPLEEPSCGQTWFKPQCSNKYFKHENECRPCRGPQSGNYNNITNERFGLPQTGFAVLSISGHYFGMSDAVEQPTGKPDWERSLRPFDYGCTNKYEGKTWWVSSTGHSIEMNDWEDPANYRGHTDAFHSNYIRLLSACGNMVELNDHTTPSGEAGDHRGIVVRSTSGHFIAMMDEGTPQQSQRCEMGDARSPMDPEMRPIRQAKKGFVQIRTGYGLEMIFKDEDSQKETKNQKIQITAHQKDNKERGQHFLRFQEKPSGPGHVALKVGGNYWIAVYDKMFTYVGFPDKGDMITVVKDNIYVTNEKQHWHSANQHVLYANQNIFLLAGKDCPTVDGELGPCIGRVLVRSPSGKIVYSDRVFASCSQNAQTANIFEMSFFQK